MASKKHKEKFQEYKYLVLIIGVIIFGVICAMLKETPSKSPDENQSVTAPSQSIAPIKSDTPKQYTQVFSFSGAGNKQSEPFLITGERFKIKYDCNGDFCSAWLKDANTQEDKDLLMNVTHSIKDETIVYGSGEYYLDVTSDGSYVITVEDFR